MGKLFDTQIGLLELENIEYLYNAGLFDKSCNIVAKEIKNSSFRRPVQLWSLFCLLREDIYEQTGVRDLNEAVNIMRNGLFGVENPYPKVDDLIKQGSRLVLISYDKQSSFRTKSSYKNFDI